MPITNVQDKILEYSVNIQRLEATVKRDIENRLAELEKALLSAPLNFKRLSFKHVDKLIEAAYKENAQYLEKLLKELSLIAKNQAIKIVNIGANASIKNADVSYTEPLIAGALLAEWWIRRKSAFQNKFKDTVQHAVNLGDFNILNRIRDEKLLSANYRSATLLARTSMQQVVNETRMNVYENLGVSKFEWISTLDARTTVICQVLDGLVWDIKTKEPIGHTKIYPGENAHWGCRSTQAPLFDDDTTPTRASMDGPVSGQLTYERWLATKPTAFQKTVLGKTRYKMWKKGSIGFTDLTNQYNNPLTIDELRDLI
jgi:SPP1 gp7 family putative phage head morphogenesis protein